MKKIIIILSLMTFFYASPVLASCPIWDTSGWCGQGISIDMTAAQLTSTNVDSGTTSANYNIISWHESVDAAAAACQAWLGGGCNQGSSGLENCLVSGTISGIGVRSGYKYANLGGGKYATLRQYYFYNAGSFIYVPPEYNPFPEASIFKWKEIGRQYDSQGNVIGQLILFQDPITGETNTQYFGDNVSDHCTQQQYDAGLCPITLVLNDYWRPGSEFNDLYGNNDLQDNPFSPIGEVTPGATVPGVSTDQTNVGDSGSTDTELLQNIATNTRFNTANQQILSDQLTDMVNQMVIGQNQDIQIGASLAGGLGAGNQLLGDIRDGINSLQDGLGAPGTDWSAVGTIIGDGVGESLEGVLIEETVFVGDADQNEWARLLGEIETFRQELDVPDEEEFFPEGAVNDENDFKLAVEDMLSAKTDTTWFQALRNLLMMDRITASGSCSASVALWGGSIDLSVCGLQGALNVFGTILLGFATITAFLVALRG